MPKKECYYGSAMFRDILIDAPQMPIALDPSFLSLIMETDIAQARREK